MSAGVRRVDQRMAAAAGRMLPAKVSNALRTRYKQLPVQLRVSGLAATYAYVLAKADDSELGQAYRRVADGIRIHLTDTSGVVLGPKAGASNEAFLRALADLEPASYARASAEVQALSVWLSRLGEARHRAQDASDAEPS